MAAKKRFTFADAKEKIKELEGEANTLKHKLNDAYTDAKLIQDNNVYDVGEQKFIKFYQYGFYILLVINILQIIF